MRLHYNASCAHDQWPTTHMRLLCANRDFNGALQEIMRLDALPLDTCQRLIVNVHEVVVKLSTRRVTYSQAKIRLRELATHIHGTGDETFIAEFRTRRVRLAAQYGDHPLAASLIGHFFDDISRTAITESHWRLAHGARAQHMQGPAAAIPFYLTVLTHLKEVDRPCLKETVARYLAFCRNAELDKQGAVDTLCDAGLPASLEPGEGKIALADLLVMPC